MPSGTLGNPTKKKIRPSSASANLQTHPDFKSGLYDNTRPTTANHAGLHSRPKTQASGPRFWSKGREDVEAKPQRRLTVGAVDGIGSRRPGLGKRMHTSVQPVGSLLKGKIEEKISIDTLDALKRKFETADVDGSGALELDEFKQLLKSQLMLNASKEAQIDALFQKIDWSSEGKITWDEFCTYMQLEYAEKEDSYHKGKEVSFIHV